MLVANVLWAHIGNGVFDWVLLGMGLFGIICVAIALRNIVRETMLPYYKLQKLHGRLNRQPLTPQQAAMVHDTVTARQPLPEQSLELED